MIQEYLNVCKFVNPYENFDKDYTPCKFIRGKIAKVRDSKINPKINRNDPCPCGSGKKYKHCCINK